MFDDVIVVYKFLGDLMFFVTGSQDENELILYQVLLGFYEAISILLRYQPCYSRPSPIHYTLCQRRIPVSCLQCPVSHAMTRQAQAPHALGARRRDDGHCTAMTCVRPGPVASI